MFDFFNHNYDSILGLIVALGILLSIQEHRQRKRQQRICAAAELITQQGRACRDVESLLDLAEKADALHGDGKADQKTRSIINGARRRLYFQAVARLLESHRSPR